MIYFIDHESRLQVTTVKGNKYFSTSLKEIHNLWEKFYKTYIFVPNPVNPKKKPHGKTTDRRFRHCVVSGRF